MGRNVSDDHDDNLHLMMALSVIAARNEVWADLRPIYAAWEARFPDDALGPLFIGFRLLLEGRKDEARDYLRVAATRKTRVDNAERAIADFDRAGILADERGARPVVPGLAALQGRRP